MAIHVAKRRIWEAHMVGWPALAASWEATLLNLREQQDVEANAEAARIPKL